MSNEYEFTSEERTFMKRMREEYHIDCLNVDFDNLSIDELDHWRNFMCTVEMERAAMDDDQWDYDARMAADLYDKTLQIVKDWDSKETEDDED